MSASAFTQSALMFGLLSVAACGGGGGGSGPTDPGGPDVTPNPDLVYADDQPVTRETFYGKTFPLMLATQNANGGEPLNRTTGTLEYVDADTVRVTINGNTTEYFFRGAFGAENWASGNLMNAGSPVSDLILDRAADLGRIARFQLYNNPGVSGFSGYNYGVFGLVTPENRLPSGSVNYSNTRAGQMLVTTTSYVDVNDDGNIVKMEEVRRIPNEGLDIDVSFADGTVSGTLFAGSYQTIDDRQFAANQVSHDMTITITNGAVDASGFSSGLDVAKTVNGEQAQITMTGSDLDGMFFGYDGQRIGGTFEAQYSESYDITTSASSDMTVTHDNGLVGAFEAERQ